MHVNKIADFLELDSLLYLIGSNVPVFENRPKMLYQSTLLCDIRLRTVSFLPDVVKKLSFLTEVEST